MRGLVTSVVLAMLAGCATVPPPAPPEAPATVPVPEDSGPVIGRDDDFVILAARPGDTLASLAERYLGDAGKAWWIAQFNNITTLRRSVKKRTPMPRHSTACALA